VLCARRSSTRAWQPLLDAAWIICRAVDVPAIKGVDEDGNEIIRFPERQEPLALAAFKIMDDPASHHHLLPDLLRHAFVGHRRHQFDPRPARSASAACC